MKSNFNYNLISSYPIMKCFRIFLHTLIYLSGLFYLIASVDHDSVKFIFQKYPEFVYLCILSVSNIFIGATGCIYNPYNNDELLYYIKTKRVLIFIIGIYNCAITIIFMKLSVFLGTFLVYGLCLLETFYHSSTVYTENNGNNGNNVNNVNNGNNGNTTPVILVNNCGEIELGIPTQK